MLDVVLFSNDEALATFCREVLTETFGAEWRLRYGHPQEAPFRHEFCIWDFTSGETVFPDVEPALLGSHCFIIDPVDAPALEARIGISELRAVYRPVTKSGLRAVLPCPQPPGSTSNSHPGGEVDRLRLERDSMLQFLIQAHLKLQEHDREQNHIVARSVHDFRAALTAISGYCGLLLESELGPLTPKQREVVARMQQSTTRIARLNSAMWQLSVPQSAQNGATPGYADIRECIDQALQEVDLFLDAKRISLGVDIEEPPESLLFDQAQIEHVLINLLNNACKFTPRGGRVEVRGYPFFWERRLRRLGSFEGSADRRAVDHRAPNSFRIDVSDSGPAIPPAYVHLVFKENASCDGRQDRSGGGLGLAICRMIVQRHQGRIWAESSASGAVFSFVLPLYPAEARAASLDGGNSKAAPRVLEN